MLGLMAKRGLRCYLIQTDRVNPNRAARREVLVRALSTRKAKAPSLSREGSENARQRHCLLAAKAVGTQGKGAIS